MQISEQFMAAHSEQAWKSTSTELGLNGLDETIRKYQDPHEADSIMKIQRDLDETKIILHKTIDGVLERGVKLDNLVEKSTDLSAQSKMYVSPLALCYRVRLYPFSDADNNHQHHVLPPSERLRKMQVL